MKYVSESGRLFKTNKGKVLMFRESSNMVGSQNFTYEELEDAWRKLNRLVDIEDGYVRDIRGFYETETIKTGDRESQWLMDYSLDDIVAQIEKIPETITYGDLEVYWNNEFEADSDDHGIMIEDGQIAKVY